MESNIKLKVLLLQIAIIIAIGVSIPTVMAQINDYGMSVWMATVSGYAAMAYVAFKAEYVLNTIGLMIYPRNKKGISH